MVGRLLIGSLAALCMAGAAGAAPPAVQVHGPTCTRARCSGAASAPVASSAAFAAAALAAGILGRRQSAAR